MAWLSQAELKHLLGRLPAYTGLTITTHAAKAARTVREQGYAVAVDELEVGLTAIAAPVRNAHDDVICSMSISGPTFRLTAERVNEVLPLLVEAADELSHRLGWGCDDVRVAGPERCVLDPMSSLDAAPLPTLCFA